jgi:GMP synthase-like glutamine amidotransferase
MIVLVRLLFIDNTETIPSYMPFEHWKPCLPAGFARVHAPSGELRGVDVRDYTHVILTGSESCTLDEKVWMLEEEELIKKTVSAKIPLLGSCFGHQLIAKALFGNEAVRVREKPEIGWREIRVKVDDRLWGNRGGRQSAFLFHNDEVAIIPSDSGTVVAESDECAIQSFRLNDAPAWGIQAHFEIGVTVGIALLNSSNNSLEEVQRGIPPLDTGFIVPLMKRFLLL